VVFIEVHRQTEIRLLKFLLNGFRQQKVAQMSCLMFLCFSGVTLLLNVSSNKDSLYIDINALVNHWFPTPGICLQPPEFFEFIEWL